MFYDTGWRPAVGWVCVAGFAYQFFLMQFLNGILAVFEIDPAFKEVNTESLEVWLVGIIGLGSMRTIEKIKGVARQ
jgi:hypothetical protein